MYRHSAIILVAFSLISCCYGQEATTTTETSTDSTLLPTVPTTLETTTVTDPTTLSTVDSTTTTVTVPTTLSTVDSTTTTVTDPTTLSTVDSTTTTVTVPTTLSTVDSTTTTVTDSTTVDSTTQEAPLSTTEATDESTTVIQPPGDSSLMCIQCESNTDANCRWTQDPSTAKICLNQSQSAGVAQCYSQTINDVVYRGCVSDRTAELGVCSDSTQCNTCATSNGCNSVAEFTCIQCDTVANSICRNHPTTYTGTYCTNAVNQTTAVCYEASFDNEYYRGCLVDVIPQLSPICADENTNDCQTCTGANCNINLPNGAAHNSAKGLIMLIATLVLVKQAI